MTGLDLLARLEARSAEAPAAPAIVEADGRTLSRQELVRRIRAVARGLGAAGLAPGERVLFAVRPSAAAIVLMTGIAEAGGVLVTAQVGVGDALFEAQMRLARPRWVVAESWLLAAMRSRLARRLVRWRGGALPSATPLAEARLLRVGPWLPSLGDTTSMDEVTGRAGAGASDRLAAETPEAPALVVFTSGTTGAPKAVVHSRGSLRATLDVVGAQLEIGVGDVLHARELHLILPALLAGAQVVVPGGGSFSAARTLRALEAHGATHLFEVTANCQRLADHAIARRRRLPASLRHVLVGAAPVRGAFLRRFQDVLPPGARAWCVYGMTEILPVAAVTLDAKLAYEGAGDLVGAPVPGVSVRTTDAGELLVSGPHLFSGYLGAPAAPAGHEHATGDQARLDGGRIVLLGRVKDMIIRREHNIYPGLHEPLIERLPGVRRCALVGVWDDAIADERVVLAVEPERWGDDERLVRGLWRALRAGPTRIDDAAQPDHIMLLALPESGRAHKVDRQAVRELARARLGLGEAACASR